MPAGGLAALLMLDKLKRIDRKNYEYDMDVAHKQDLALRQSPTIPEQSQQLSDLEPSALEQLIRFTDGTNIETSNLLRLMGLDLQRQGLENTKQNQAKIDEDRDLRREAEFQQKVLSASEKYDKSLAPFISTLSQFENEVEPKIGKGFKFENYDFDTNKYKDDQGQDRKLDLPTSDIGGYQLGDFFGTFLNKKGGDFKSAIDKLVQPEVHALFGSTRTAGEISTIRSMLAEGSLRTEAQYANALKRLKMVMKDEFGELESKYVMNDIGRKVLENKEEAGGTTYRSKYSEKSQKTKQSVPAGAVGIAKGEDGKDHYHDKEGNDLGLAQ